MHVRALSARKRKKKSNAAMFFAIAAVILALDQLTKFLVCRNLGIHESIPLIKNVFHLTLVYNRGAAFGLLKNQVPLFIITSFAAIVLICVSLRDAGHKLYRLSLWLILSGAIGNLIDRVAFGYVIDFLDFRIWPVFNIADSAITCGAILLSWTVIVKKHSSA